MTFLLIFNNYCELFIKKMYAVFNHWFDVYEKSWLEPVIDKSSVSLYSVSSTCVHVTIPLLRYNNNYVIALLL